MRITIRAALTPVQAVSIMQTAERFFLTYTHRRSMNVDNWFTVRRGHVVADVLRHAQQPFQFDVKQENGFLMPVNDCKQSK